MAVGANNANVIRRREIHPYNKDSARVLVVRMQRAEDCPETHADARERERERERISISKRSSV